jgi:hypothetical protein
MAASERKRLKLLEREVWDLRRVNEILRKAQAHFAQAKPELCSSHDGVRGRRSRRVRSRADLPGAGDRSADVPPPLGTDNRSGSVPQPQLMGPDVVRGDPVRAGRKPDVLRKAGRGGVIQTERPPGPPWCLESFDASPQEGT